VAAFDEAVAKSSSAQDIIAEMTGAFPNYFDLKKSGRV